MKEKTHSNRVGFLMEKVMPNVLLKCVTQSGYSASLKSGLVSQELDGGAPRYRRFTKNAFHAVNVRWVVNENGFEYLNAFHNVWCESPNEPFYAPLKVNGPVYKNYECYFVEDSFQVGEPNGVIFTITAQLRVRPIVDLEQDRILVEVGNEGVDLSELTNPLEKLVNVDMPNALRGVNVF